MSDTIANDLCRVQSWAQEKIAQGSEPPWAWYQYMKLIETINALRAGQAATQPTASSPQSAEHPGAHLRLVDATDPRDSAQHRPAGLPVQLPT
jgi:hypothetical protein